MLPQDNPTLNILLTQMSGQLKSRHELTQLLIPKLKDFGEGPRNIDVPPNYPLRDIEAVVPIFRDFGFRVEIRFASQNTHLRFYRG